jgi:hypothetical protein
MLRATPLPVAFCVLEAPKMADLRDEIQAFQRMLPQLEADHMHRWVLIHDGELIGSFGRSQIRSRAVLD